jgi:tetratricopeptide (TPR) repeat protein
MKVLPRNAERQVPWRTLRRIFTVCIFLAPFGCGSSRVDRQNATLRSASEYDLAQDAWLRRGNPREGLAHVLKAIELDDENADAEHLTALIYLDLCQLPGKENCRLDAAKTHAERALQLKTDYREAKNTLGVVLIHMKRPSDAISVLRPLTSDILYPTPEIAWGNMGWAYLESGKLDEAVEALERSVAAQPRFCVGFFRLGLAREKKGMFESAVEAYSSALDADPRCASLQDAYLGRARVELRLEHKDPARVDLDACVRLAKETAAGKECDSLRQNLK